MEVLDLKKALLLITFIIISLVLIACGTDSSNGDNEQGSQLMGTFSTGSSGGLYDLIGGGMINVINQNSENIQMNTTVPPSISEVPRMLDTGQALVGIGMADMMERAKKGEGEFDEKYENVQPVFAMYDNVMAIVTRGDSDIQNINELSGKRIGVSSVSTQDVVAAYLELAGVSKDDVEWVFLSYAEQAEALKEDQIDVGNFTAFPKAGLLEDLSVSPHGMKILDIDDDIRNAWDEEYPLWANGEIPAGTYSGVDEDKYYYTMFTVLYANKDVSEDSIYELTEIVFNNHDDISAIHPATEDIIPEKTIEYIDRNVLNPDDLHGGAKRYFEEAGYLE